MNTVVLVAVVFDVVLLVEDVLCVDVEDVLSVDVEDVLCMEVSLSPVYVLVVAVLVIVVAVLVVFVLLVHVHVELVSDVAVKVALVVVVVVSTVIHQMLPPCFETRVFQPSGVMATPVHAWEPRLWSSVQVSPPSTLVQILPFWTTVVSLEPSSDIAKRAQFLLPRL